jgi:glyoxylase-like metal-dependent hydrolase (beta-lactamase superfamily II)
MAPRETHQKIMDEIDQVGGGSLTSPEDAAIYPVCSHDRAALVDAGCGFSQSRLFKNIEACGVKLNSIEYLLLTHCHFDHTGGAQAVKDTVQNSIPVGGRIGD